MGDAVNTIDSMYDLIFERRMSDPIAYHVVRSYVAGLVDKEWAVCAYAKAKMESCDEMQKYVDRVSQIWTSPVQITVAPNNFDRIREYVRKDRPIGSFREETEDETSEKAGG